MNGRVVTQRSIAPFEVRLLGGFTLLHDANTVTIPTSLQRLIAFLALRGPVPRCTAAGTLWSSASEERAMGSLRTAVWRIRRTVPGLLTQSSGSLALAGDVTVDVAALEAAVDVSQRNESAKRPLPDLLPGWYDDWIIMERERYRHRYLRLLESAAAAAIDDGKLNAAIDWALVAAAVDPLRESAHRLVIQALLADGNIDAARRHLGFVQAVFREQLGVVPSQQLTALFQHARTGTRRTNSARRTLPSSVPAAVTAR